MRPGGIFSKSVRGFTLVELVVVVLCMAILAGIAFPSMAQYMVRAKLAHGTQALMEMRLRMEKTFASDRRYTLCSGPLESVPPSQYFTFSCASDGFFETFLITATSKGGEGLGDAGSYVYSINEGEQRKTEVFQGAAVNLTCWKIKSNDSCA